MVTLHLLDTVSETKVLLELPEKSNAHNIIMLYMYTCICIHVYMYMYVKCTDTLYVYSRQILKHTDKSTCNVYFPAKE